MARYLVYTFRRYVDLDERFSGVICPIFYNHGYYLKLGVLYGHEKGKRGVEGEPEPKGGTHSPAGEGVGVSQFEGREKRLSTLSTLWPGPFKLTYKTWAIACEVEMVRFIPVSIPLFSGLTIPFTYHMTWCSDLRVEESKLCFVC